MRFCIEAIINPDYSKSTDAKPYSLQNFWRYFFFSRAEIKDMMAYLRLVVNQDDDAAFLRIVNTPKREIGTATLQKLGELAQEKHISLFDAIFEFELIQRITPKAYDSLQKFGRWIVELNDEIQRSEPERAVRSMLSAIHYEEYLYEYATSPKAAEMQSKNVATLFDWVADMLKAMKPMSR